MKVRLVPLLLPLVLAGCLDGEGGTSAAAGGPAVVDSAAPAWRLVPAGSAERLARHLAQGGKAQADGELPALRTLGAPARMVFVDTNVVADGPVLAPAVEGMAMPSRAMTSGAGALPADNGLANTQVRGVEEPDRVKSDGRRLYVAQLPEQPRIIRPLPIRGPVIGLPVEIMADDRLAAGALLAEEPEIAPAVPAQIARYGLDSATPAAEALPPLELPGADGWLHNLSLMLAGDTLVAMGQTGNDWHWLRWFAPPTRTTTAETRLWLFDTADAAGVQPRHQLKIRGELVDSRRVGDYLYLVTRFRPQGDARGDELLPDLVADGNARPLLPPGQCLLPPHGRGYPALTLVTAVNLAQPSQSRAACYAGEVYTLYMSTEALYLATSEYNEDFDWSRGTPEIDDAGAVRTRAGRPVAPVDTLLHKFDLRDGNPRYVASGRVAGGFTGWLGTGSQPQWRFHERDGRLFLVTSWWDDDDLHHHLYVLAPVAGGDLAVQAMLPNAQAPDPIGKPREDIHAMRYVGDRAYVVTFRQTDPLYVLDLADPLAPRIAGELELPGFSAYLHPLDENWLLGIGRGAQAGSIEANLFDVRNPARPRVQATQKLCRDCDAPLMTDYHAIAVLAGRNVTRIAVPLQRWQEGEDGNWGLYEEAALLEAGDDGLLADLGRQRADAGHDVLGRVLLVNDAVFQPQVDHVTSGFWPR
jgi:hypothetical protein